MILIKDRGNHTYVFCNVEFIMHEDEKGNGYLTVRRLENNALLYKNFTDNIKQLTVDGISLIATFDL